MKVAELPWSAHGKVLQRLPELLSTCNTRYQLVIASVARETYEDLPKSVVCLRFRRTLETRNAPFRVRATTLTL